MILRDATPQDAEALAAIANHYICNTTVSFNEVEKTPQAIGTEISQAHLAGHAFLVADSGAHLAGYASYAPFRRGTGYRHTMELTLLLDPQRTGQGTGALLMQALETHARAAGIHSLVAGISAENERAIAFHRKMGFAQVGRLAQVGRKCDRWIDLILMQKRLSPATDSG